MKISLSPHATIEVCRALCTMAEAPELWNALGPSERFVEMQNAGFPGVSVVRHSLFSLTGLVWQPEAIGRERSPSLPLLVEAAQPRIVRMVGELLISLADDARAQSWAAAVQAQRW